MIQGERVPHLISYRRARGLPEAPPVDMSAALGPRTVMQQEHDAPSASGRIPHDLVLEQEVLGSILTRYATCTNIAPRHFYLPAHATILAAWRNAREPPDHLVALRDGDQLIIGHHFDGLERQLLALDPAGTARLLVRAAVIASVAPVTTVHDVARLRLLAYKRRRLAVIEAERSKILGV